MGCGQSIVKYTAQSENKHRGEEEQTDQYNSEDIQLSVEGPGEWGYKAGTFQVFSFPPPEYKLIF